MALHQIHPRLWPREKSMKIDQAKKYVADKLGTSVKELVDPVRMGELREDLNIGLINPQPGFAQGMEAKLRISKLLDIEINSVERFINKSGL
jgi:dimethylamine--corrinoid protein Co-methyltransferase